MHHLSTNDGRPVTGCEHAASPPGQPLLSSAAPPPPPPPPDCSSVSTRSTPASPMSPDAPAVTDLNRIAAMLQALPSGTDAALAAAGATLAADSPPPSSGSSAAVSPAAGYVTPPKSAIDATDWGEFGRLGDLHERQQQQQQQLLQVEAAVQRHRLDHSHELGHNAKALPLWRQPQPTHRALYRRYETAHTVHPPPPPSSGPISVVVGRLQPSAPHIHPLLASGLPPSFPPPSAAPHRHQAAHEHGAAAAFASQHHHHHEHGAVPMMPSVAVGVNRVAAAHRQLTTHHRHSYSYPSAIAEYARAMATERRSAALNSVHAPPAPDVADFARFVRAADLPDTVACMALGQAVTTASPALLAAGLAQWRPAARAGAGVAVQTLVVGQMPYFVDAAGVGRLLVELAATDAAVAAAGGAPFAASAIVAVRAHERVKPAHGSGTTPRRCGLWFVEVATDGACKMVLDALLATHRKALVSDTHVTVVSGGTTLERWAAGRDAFLQRLMAEVPDVRRDAHSRFQKGLGPVSIQVCEAPMRRG